MTERLNGDRKPVVTPKQAGIGGAIAAILAAVFALEGGFVDHKDDPGGATNHGITERVARQNGFSGEMRDLTRAEAATIYERQYIAAPGFRPLVEIDAVVAEEVIDTAVNMGPARPSRFFQRSLNELCGSELVVDGDIGLRTVLAWKRCRDSKGALVCVAMLDRLDAQQRAEYDRLVRVNPRLRVFYRGWINHRIGNVDRERCA